MARSLWSQAPSSPLSSSPPVRDNVQPFTYGTTWKTTRSLMRSSSKDGAFGRFLPISRARYLRGDSLSPAEQLLGALAALLGAVRGQRRCGGVGRLLHRHPR